MYSRTSQSEFFHSYLAQKKGWSKEQTDQTIAHVTGIAKQVGLDFHFEKAVVANSLDAHRLSHLAKKYGKQNDLEESIIKQIPTIKIPNVVFRNKGDLEFEMLTEKAGSNPSYSNGSAYSDLDNDGDLDIVVNTINQTALLLENKSTDTINNNYISFTLKGDSIYKNTTGAKLYIYADNMVKYNELNVTRGFQSSSTHKIHFGIGKTQKIDSVKVQWLDGTFQIIKGVSVNQHHVLTRNNSIQKRFISIQFLHQMRLYNL